MGGTVLRTAVARFCSLPCIAHVRVHAAGLMGWNVLGNAPDQGKFGYLPVATIKSLSEALQIVPYVIPYGEEHQDNAYRSLQSNLSLQSRCFTAFPIDSWMHSIYI